MAMHLVALLAALIQQRQLEKRPHVGPLASQRDKKRNVRRIVLHALAIGIEINCPRVSTHHERIGSYVLADPKALRQGIAGDFELVRSVNGLGDRRRCGAFRGGGRGGIGFVVFPENLSHDRELKKDWLGNQIWVIFSGKMTIPEGTGGVESGDGVWIGFKFENFSGKSVFGWVRKSRVSLGKVFFEGESERQPKKNEKERVRKRNKRR